MGQETSIGLWHDFIRRIGRQAETAFTNAIENPIIRFLDRRRLDRIRSELWAGKSHGLAPRGLIARHMTSDRRAARCDNGAGRKPLPQLRDPAPRGTTDHGQRSVARARTRPPGAVAWSIGRELVAARCRRWRRRLGTFAKMLHFTSSRPPSIIVRCVFSSPSPCSWPCRALRAPRLYRGLGSASAGLTKVRQSG